MKKLEELTNDNYIGYKIKLYPTSDQGQIFKEYFGTCRYVYNLGIHLQEENRKEYLEGKSKYSLLSYFALERKFSEFKKKEEYSWLNNFDNYIKYILHDVVNAYKKFLNNISGYPRRKKKKNYHQMFPVRQDKLSIQEDSVRIPSIGFVSCDRHNHPEIIGNGNKNATRQTYRHYYNSRVIFDGCDYWLTFEMEVSNEEGIEANSCKRFKNNEIWQHKKETETIGIDWGAKKDNWFVDSRGNRIKQPDCSKEERQVKKYQRKLAIKKRVNDKKFIMGKKINSTMAEDAKRNKRSYTKNEEKILKKLNKAYKRKTNKKLAVIHEYACSLIAEKPKSINMEHLIVKDMLYNKEDPNISYKHRQNHNKKIYDAIYYTSKTIIERKCKANNIKFNLVDKEYPSTQLCSCCGHRQKIGISKVYKCPICGLEIDRDLNAAYNIRDYKEDIISIDLDLLSTLYA